MKRRVREVTISDLRFSNTQDRMLVEFSVSFDPSTTLEDSLILTNDGFGRFVGQWASEDKSLQILVK